MIRMNPDNLITKNAGQKQIKKPFNNYPMIHNYMP